MNGVIVGQTVWALSRRRAASSVFMTSWELVGSQTDGEVESVSLMSVLNDTDMELIAQFREALEQYVDLETTEFIEAKKKRAWLAGSGRPNNSERLLSRGYK